MKIERNQGRSSFTIVVVNFCKNFHLAVFLRIIHFKPFSRIYLCRCRIFFHLFLLLVFSLALYFLFGNDIDTVFSFRMPSCICYMFCGQSKLRNFMRNYLCDNAWINKLPFTNSVQTGWTKFSWHKMPFKVSQGLINNLKSLFSRVFLGDWFSTIFCIFIYSFPGIHLFLIKCNLFWFHDRVWFLPTQFCTFSSHFSWFLLV